MLTEVIATTEGMAACATPATGPFSFATASALTVSLLLWLVSSETEEVSVSAVPTDVVVSFLKY